MGCPSPPRRLPHPSRSACTDDERCHQPRRPPTATGRPGGRGHGKCPVVRVGKRTAGGRHRLAVRTLHAPLAGHAAETPCVLEPRVLSTQLTWSLRTPPCSWPSSQAQGPSSQGSTGRSPTGDPLSLWLIPESPGRGWGWGLRPSWAHEPGGGGNHPHRLLDPTGPGCPRPVYANTCPTDAQTCNQVARGRGLQTPQITLQTQDGIIGSRRIRLPHRPGAHGLPAQRSHTERRPRPPDTFCPGLPEASPRPNPQQLGAGAALIPRPFPGGSAGRSVPRPGR